MILHTLASIAHDAVSTLPALPDPGATQPPGTEGVDTILGWLKWVGYVVVAGAVIVGGIMIAVNLRRGEGQDALPKILWPMAGAIVIGAGISWVSMISGA
ncbi:MAG: hypothetical protein FWH11_06840 [Micrococcales bacterium]|nr:hypothetical protein [Micrococcales bacterium]